MHLEAAVKVSNEGEGKAQAWVSTVLWAVSDLMQMLAMLSQAGPCLVLARTIMRTQSSITLTASIYVHLLHALMRYRWIHSVRPPRRPLARPFSDAVCSRQLWGVGTNSLSVPSPPPFSLLHVVSTMVVRRRSAAFPLPYAANRLRRPGAGSD